MSKVVKLIEPFEQLSGKLCQHSKFLINLGKKGVLKDKMWTGKMCNGRDLTEKPYTSLEATAHERFKAVRLAVKAIKASPTQLSAAYDQYREVRDDYKSFDSFLWKKETAAWNEEHSGEESPEEEELVEE